jgi:hypothetical protein
MAVHYCVEVLLIHHAIVASVLVSSHVPTQQPLLLNDKHRNLSGEGSHLGGSCIAIHLFMYVACIMFNYKYML